MKNRAIWFFSVVFLCAGFFFAYKNFKPVPSEGSREPASSAAGGQEQQQIIDRMNAKIIGLQNRTQVKAVALEVMNIASEVKDKKYPAVEMYAAVASLVPSLEGIVYRCRLFIEKTDWLHASILFGFRDFKYNNYLYGSHVDALFDYLTYPSESAGKPFKTISELQDYLLFNLAPRLEAVLKVATELEAQPSENFEFQFDRTLLVGQKNDLRFIDPSEVKKTFIKPYFFTLEFLAQRALATIYYVAAIDLDELPIVFNRVLKKTTLNNFVGNLRIGEPVKGVTPQMTYETIKETKSFLKWRQRIALKDQNIQVQDLLDRAFYYGQVSASMQLAAYVCGLKYPYQRSHGQIMQIQNKYSECVSLDQLGSTSSYFITEGDKYLFNPNSMILNVKKKYNMFRDRARAYQESSQGRFATITSDVTGQSVQVNVKAFFNSKVSPRDLLPAGYVNVKAASPSTLAGVDAWNYDHGKPLLFNDYTFGGFFNSAQVSNSESLYKAMSTVLYTDALAPFAIFVRVPSTVRYFIPPSEIVRE